MAQEWDPDDILDLLDDERTRQVLVSTNIKPRSVEDLVETCDGSQSSIYRRVAVLEDCGLLAEENRIDGNGSHYSVYKPNFDEIEIEIRYNKWVVNVNGTEYTDEFPRFG